MDLNPKAGSRTPSSEEIGIKNSVFRTEFAMKGRVDLMPKLRAKKRSRVLGQQLAWQDVLKLSQNLRGEAERILGQEVNRCLPIKFLQNPASP